MIRVEDALEELRGRVSALVLRYMTAPQLLWLLAWGTDWRAAVRLDGGYLRDIAARSPCWTEESLRVRLQTGRALLFHQGGCLWDSKGEAMGLTIADACSLVDARLVGMVEEARPEKMVLCGVYGLEFLHVSRLDGAEDVLLVID